jgi:hypothetical protein
VQDQGRTALVFATLATNNDHAGHSSALHDHAHSGDTPSHVLEWDDHAGQVVTNAALTSGSTGIVAHDQSGAATTTEELAALSLVELLARILGLQAASAHPTRFEIATPPGVTWDSSAIEVVTAVVDTQIHSITFTTPPLLVNRGSWSDNKNPDRSLALRPYTVDNANDFAPLKGPAHVIRESDIEVSPVKHNTVMTSQVLTADLTSLLYGNKNAAAALSASWQLEVAVEADNIVLRIAEGSYVPTSCKVTSVPYFNEDEPPSDDGQVLSDGSAFRRLYAWPVGTHALSDSHAYTSTLDVGGDDWMPLVLSELSRTKIVRLEEPALPSYAGGTTDLTISNSTDFQYTSLANMNSELNSLLVGGLRLQYDEIALNLGGVTARLRTVTSIRGAHMTETSAVDPSHIAAVNESYFAIDNVGTDSEMKAHVLPSIEDITTTTNNYFADNISTSVRQVQYTKIHPKVDLHFDYRGALDNGVPEAQRLIIGDKVAVCDKVMRIPFPIIAKEFFATQSVNELHLACTWQRSFGVSVKSTDMATEVTVNDGVPDSQWRKHASLDRHCVDRRRSTLLFAINDTYSGRNSEGEGISDHISAGLTPFTAVQTLKISQEFSIEVEGIPAKFTLSDHSNSEKLVRKDQEDCAVTFDSFTSTSHVQFLPVAEEWIAGNIANSPVRDFNDVVRDDLGATTWKGGYGFSSTPGPRSTTRCARTESLRYGAVFMLDTYDKSSENIALPLDQDVQLDDGGVYRPYENLGVKNTDDPPSSYKTDYSKATLPSVPVAAVRDSGDGTLNSIEGFVIKQTFLHSCRLHVTFSSTHWSKVNNVDLQYTVVTDTGFTTVKAHEMPLTTSMVYSWSCDEGPITWRFVRDGTVHTISTESNTELVMSVSGKSRNFDMQLGTTTGEGYTHKLAFASIDPRSTVMSLTAHKDGTDPSPAYAAVLNFLPQFDIGGTGDLSLDSGHFLKAVFTGMRASLRRGLRRQKNNTHAGVLRPALDFTPVSDLVEFVEWPRNGTKVMGHPTEAYDDDSTENRRWIELRARPIDGSQQEVSVFDSSQRVVTRSSHDGYNRYCFGSVTIATNGHYTKLRAPSVHTFGPAFRFVQYDESTIETFLTGAGEYAVLNGDALVVVDTPSWKSTDFDL